MPRQDNDFDSIFDFGMDVLMARIGNKTDATLTHLADASSYTIQVIFNEQVGFIDDIRRAVLVVDEDDVTQEIRRGDYFVLAGETDRWYCQNVRIDKIGTYEIRCDSYLERL